MKVTKVTEQNGYVEYHVDQKLRQGDNLSEAGVRLMRVIVLAGTGVNDYTSIDKKSFTVKTTRVNRGQFIAAVSQYGDKSPSLTMTWKQAREGLRLEIKTNLVFSKRDRSMLSIGKPPRVMTIDDGLSYPAKSIALICLSDVDRAAVEKFARTVLG